MKPSDKDRMMCPRCDLPLKETQTKTGVWIDICQQCWGLWLDGDETDYAGYDYGLPEPDEVHEGTFECPRCGGEIEEWWYDINIGKMIIDRCKSCEGVWLDSKELKVLRKMEKGSPDAELKEYLEEHQSIPPSPHAGKTQLLEAYGKLAMMEATREERKDYYKEQFRSRRHRGFWHRKRSYLSKTARKHQAEIDGRGYHDWQDRFYYLKNNPKLFIVAMILFFVLVLLCDR
jgi:Zn-finger nucleic acid-binding protein